MTKVLSFSRLEISSSKDIAPNVIFNFHQPKFKRVSSFQAPSLPRRNNNPRSNSSATGKKVRISVEAKGKKNPKLVKRKIEIKVSLSQVKEVLLRQIATEEKVCLKNCGVAVFYAQLLYRSLKPNSGSKCSKCPICSKDQQLSVQSLNEKLLKDTKQMISFASKSQALNKKRTLLESLNPHKNMSKSSNESNDFCAFAHLATSDFLLENLKSWVSGKSNLSDCFFRDLDEVSEVQMGKKDALRLIKMRMLDSNSCAICNSSLSLNQLSKSLSSIDKSLSSIQ